MDYLFGWLTDWIKQGLIDGIMGQFSGVYDSINNQVGQIAANVGQTPQGWNSGVFSMIRSLSDTAVIPIAGMIITFVLTYELIQLIIEKNNMHEFDVMNLYKWIVKTFASVFILTHTFDIVMGIFGLAQSVVTSSAGLISGSIQVDGAAALAHLQTLFQDMGIWELLGLWFETNLLNICMSAITICVFLIVFGRMIEIYLTVSVAPIPFATMANREWGQLGTNYLKVLFALAFQGFLIMVCVAIYAVLVQNIPTADSVHAAIWGTAAYTVLLCFCLFKTGSLSRSVFSAH